MKKDEFKKKHKIKTEHEFDKKKEEIAGEVEEKVDAMGQRSDKKAAKWVVENEEELEKIADEVKNKRLFKLKKSRKLDNKYLKQVLQILHNLTADVPFNKKYQWRVGWDGTGFVLAVKDKYGKLWKRAFKPSFEPKYDLQACRKLAIWAEDIYDYSEGNLDTMKTPGGVWLPPKKSLSNL